jgi:hypothetical protein
MSGGSVRCRRQQGSQVSVAVRSSTPLRPGPGAPRSGRRREIPVISTISSHREPDELLEVPGTGCGRGPCGDGEQVSSHLGQLVSGENEPVPSAPILRMSPGCDLGLDIDATSARPEAAGRAGETADGCLEAGASLPGEALDRLFYPAGELDISRSRGRRLRSARGTS